MFVKKFEAPSLEEALLSIKSELGPNALILSTTEKKGKWFNKPIVEVTAAYDGTTGGKATSAPAQADPFGEDELRKIFPHRRRAASTVSEEEVVETKKRPAETVKYADIKGPRQESRSAEAHGRDFMDLGMQQRTAEELGRRLRYEYAKSDLEKPESLERAKIRLLAEGLSCVTRESLAQKKRWLVVGAPGAGKTTLVAKLALLLRSEGHPVRLGSCDKRKLLGRRELASYARLLQIPFENSNEERDDAILLLDTASLAVSPGMGASSSERWAELKSHSRNSCGIFVCDTTARSEEVIHAIELTRAQTHLHALVFTRADCNTRLGMIYEVVRQTRIPVLAVSYSQGFQSALRFFSNQELATAIVRHGMSGSRVKGAA